jgi:hypothetical protein
MFLAIRETRFAKRIVRQLLTSHSAVSARNPDLSGEPLYREVLLHTELVDSSRVEEILSQAEDSMDEWTTHSKEGLGFRQVAHFVVMSQYRAAGNSGAVVSFKEIVYSLISADL